jgi:hypothetical protein
MLQRPPRRCLQRFPNIHSVCVLTSRMAQQASSKRTFAHAADAGLRISLVQQAFR